jgi:adenosylcobyric acid synthase
MNPILIKPEADSQSQVILMGKPWSRLQAREYYPQKEELWRHVTRSLDQLRSNYDLVIIEGAGSPAELNLKASDIVNMRVAAYAQAATLLVGDIDRGGIFAQLLGTLWLLPPEEQALLKGFIVNKFRGDITLFEDGVDILEEKSGIPVLGVMPYLHDLFIPEEDAVALENLSPVQLASTDTVGDGAVIDIAVIRLPRIANFDDFDPLSAESGVRLRYVDSVEHLGLPDAVIIPGTKSTSKDLTWLRARGFDLAIQEHVQRGGAVVGICGGYQMLGNSVRDPDQVESDQTNMRGLELLPIETIFVGDKATYQAVCTVRNGLGWMAQLNGERLRGYEIHMGRTRGENAWLEIGTRNETRVSVLDGAISVDGKIWGCYLHGLFGNDRFRRAWLTAISTDQNWQPSEKEVQDDLFQASLTYLTDTLESSLDMDKIDAMVFGRS